MRPFDGRAIPTFIRQALAGEPLTVAGTGAQTRSICYVSDLVAGILAMSAADHSGPINIGNPTELSVRQIAEDVIAATGSSSTIEFVERPVDDPEVRRPDASLAASALGWQPAVIGLRAFPTRSIGSPGRSITVPIHLMPRLLEQRGSTWRCELDGGHVGTRIQRVPGVVGRETSGKESGWPTGSWPSSSRG